MRPKARVYIDGFNSYYGVVRGTTLKWLDIEKLCDRLLPQFDVERILYFTAHALRIFANPAETTCRSPVAPHPPATEASPLYSTGYMKPVPTSVCAKPELTVPSAARIS